MAREYSFQVGNRAFLNKPNFHEDASLSWHMSVEGTYFDGSISIRDCSENVRLELDVHNDEWYENSIFKINTMISLLQEAKEYLPKARKALEKAKNEATDSVSQG